MKKLLICTLFIIVLFAGCSSGQDETFDVRQVFSFEYERAKAPDADQLSIVRYVLKNTGENNIHKMRGEIENQVYVNPDGKEAVYDKDGNLVTNSYNQGSYNYYFYEEEPIKHFIGDTAPWLLWGNAEDDPTTYEERLYYYTLDLDYGIQSYIFEEAKETIEAVQFNGLSKNEKEVYYIFLKILFNEDYTIQLSQENMQRLIDDGEYYYEYFTQVQKFLAVIE